jgi:hypothetical protein
MTYEYNGYHRGHDIPCKHCGNSLTLHVLWDDDKLDPEDKKGDKDSHKVADKKKKGYKYTLANCSGYEPKNKKLWEKREKEFRKEEGLESY